jgi:hypothetical protein
MIKIKAAAIIILFISAASAKAQVGWSVGQFGERFPDSVATREMGHCCTYGGEKTAACFILVPRTINQARKAGYKIVQEPHQYDWGTEAFVAES